VSLAAHPEPYPLPFPFSLSLVSSEPVVWRRTRISRVWRRRARWGRVGSQRRRSDRGSLLVGDLLYPRQRSDAVHFPGEATCLGFTRPSRSSFRLRTMATTDAPPLVDLHSRPHVRPPVPPSSLLQHLFLSLSVSLKAVDSNMTEGAHASSRNFACVIPRSMAMLLRRPWQPALRGQDDLVG
jgi:hypothetical protein